MKRATSALLAILLASGTAAARPAQVRAVGDAFKRDAKALQDYTWTSRTEFSVNGEVKELTLARVRYDANGNLLSTPLDGTSRGEAGPQERRRRPGRRQRRVAARGRELRELIRAYTEFTPEQMHSAFARASVFPGHGEGEGLIRIQVSGVVREGDSMQMWADALTKRMRRFEILTSLEGEPVRVITEFGELENGPTYPARTVVHTEERGKRLVIEAENSDYVRRDG
jgi:hypothetical protein